MAANRPALDELMAQEGSRAIHEEFILAEGGTLPDRSARIARARTASARAWMRHLAQAVAAELPGAPPDLADRLTVWMNGNGERLEALVLEEQAVLERRGASGDPQADRRDAELAATARLFAEGFATITAPEDGEGAPPADFGRRVAAWSRAAEGRRREVEREAVEAWGAVAQAARDDGRPGVGPRAGRAPRAGGGRGVGPRPHDRGGPRGDARRAARERPPRSGRAGLTPRRGLRGRVLAQAPDQVGHVGRPLLQVALVLLQPGEPLLPVEGAHPERAARRAAAAATAAVVMAMGHEFTSPPRSIRSMNASRTPRASRSASAQRPSRARPASVSR